MDTASRYKNDFEELAILGRGGFGFVTKCRSRISPDSIYAVKCIELGKQSDSIDFMLREASHLARLHHKNVVRYFTAWLEKEHSPVNPPITPGKEDWNDSGLLAAPAGRPRGDSDSSNQSAPYMRADNNSGDAPDASPTERSLQNEAIQIDSFWRQDRIRAENNDIHHNIRENTRGSLESEEIKFAESSAEDDLFDISDRNEVGDCSASSDCVSFQVSRQTAALTREHAKTIGRGDSKKNSSMNTRTRMSSSLVNQRLGRLDIKQANSKANTISVISADPAYEGDRLYIVMEYVEGYTLRNMIANRLCDDHNLAWDLFRQILEGLSYMHQNNLLHRDVKPENIFVRIQNSTEGAEASSTFHVKIGDLGLSKTFDPNLAGSTGTLSRPESASQYNSKLSTNVGTHFYIAPEVEAGGLYAQDADMYALGVVVFEMFHPPFETTMERYKELTALQATREVRGVNDLSVANIVKGLLDRNPAARPSASELLETAITQPVNNGLIPIINNVLQRPYSYEMLKVLTAIFGRTEKPVETIIRIEPPEAAKVRQQFHKVMRTCSAIWFELPAWIPQNENLHKWFDRPAKFVDTSGRHLEPPSCFASILKYTLPGIKNATVVRRYNVTAARGVNETLPVAERLHGVFDVTANSLKLSQERHPNDTLNATEPGDSGLERMCIFEMEPLFVAWRVFQAYQHLIEEIRVICVYNRLMPLIVHFYLDTSLESSQAVADALRGDVREAALMLKSIHDADFDRAWSFSHLEERVREVKKLLSFEGSPGEIKNLVYNLVGSHMTEASELDRSVIEIKYILSKLQYWEDNYDVKSVSLGCHTSAVSLPEVRFRIYDVELLAMANSRSGFAFTFLSSSINGHPLGGASVRESGDVTLALGGSLAQETLCSHYVEFDLQLLVDINASDGVVSNSRSNKRTKNKALIAQSVPQLTVGVATLGFTTKPGSGDPGGSLPLTGNNCPPIGAKMMISSPLDLGSGHKTSQSVSSDSKCLNMATPLDAKLWFEGVCSEEQSSSWHQYVAASTSGIEAVRHTPLVLVVVSDKSLINDAYWLKSRLSDSRIACEVSSVLENEWAKARKSTRVVNAAETFWWLVYITYRGKSTAREKGYRFCGLKQQGGAGKDQEDKWFESRMNILRVIINLYIIGETESASIENN